MKNDNPFRIIVADCHEMILYGLEGHLRNNPAIRIVGTARHLDELVRLLDTQPADILVTETYLLPSPGEGDFVGINIIEYAKRANPKMTVIIHTDALENCLYRPTLQILLDVGADGVILKSNPVYEFVPSVMAISRAAQSGSKVLPRRIMELDIDERLSEAETKVLTYLALQPDDTIGNCAENLGIAVEVAELHLSELYEKLGISGRFDPVSTAIQLGILPQNFANIPTYRQHGRRGRSHNLDCDDICTVN